MGPTDEMKLSEEDLAYVAEIVHRRLDEMEARELHAEWREWRLENHYWPYLEAHRVLYRCRKIVSEAVPAEIIASWLPQE